MKIIDNTPIKDFNEDWGDPDGTGMKEKSKEQVQKFIKKKFIGLGYTFLGKATPSTVPATITIEDKFLYIATEEGDYTNFGLGNISELSMVKSDNGSWKVEGIGISFKGNSTSVKDIFYKIEIVNPTRILAGVAKRKLDGIDYNEKTVHSTLPITISPTAEYFYSGRLRSVLLAGVTFYDKDLNYIGYFLAGTGSNIDYSDEKINVPLSATYMIASSIDEIPPIIKVLDYADKFISYDDILEVLPKEYQEIEVTVEHENKRLDYTGNIVTSSSGYVSTLIPIDKTKRYQVEVTVDSYRVGVAYYDDSYTFVGSDIYKKETGWETFVVDIITPKNAKYMRLCSGKKPVLKDLFLAKTAPLSELIEFQEKLEARLEEITENISDYSPLVYGVRWKIDDMDDLGERCFDAIGLNAAIGIGSTNGHSDFDNIYPWSEIKRCNVNINTNGAKIVTFEGEDGFAVDGSNGDVFVRIPKFRVQAYKEDGYEYRTISQNLGYIHPAFIEQGIELDEVFIAAYEASKDGNPFDDTSGDGKLYSIGGVIPANNIVAQRFLDMAKAKGEQYSLYDMRSVDLLWTLMAVEYGCRNSNRILGYGYSDYIQTATYQTWSIVTIAANTTNTVTCGKISSASERVYKLNSFAVGNNICICRNNDQRDIIAERKITSIQCASADDNLIITFDGDPIDVDTTCFVGNAPASCNHCESITDTNAALSWHTGRTNRALISGGGNIADTMNVCRYRWIENPVGNLWHFLPDVSFKDLQMYICRNMKSYEMFKIDGDYRPVGNMLPKQGDNGAKSDINTTSNPNYWITSLVDDYFAKGVSFGKTFDEIHDGNITSAKGFGAYYYLGDGTRTIANGGGFDHKWRCNMLTNRAWMTPTGKWYLYGARLIFKNI